MESFSGIKTKPSPTKTETKFYDLMLERLEAASDRKIKQELDAVSKKMTIHFEGIPANVLGISWEKATAGYSMLPVHKDFIASILMSGIVDSAFINKAQLKKDQSAALDILFQVILPIFVRIDVYLRNSDGPIADKEFIAMIRKISDEEWTLSSCSKVNKSLDELADFGSSLKSHPEQRETRFFAENVDKGGIGVPLPSPVFRSVEEYLRVPEGSLADADIKRRCLLIGDKHYSVRPLSLKRKNRILRKCEEIKQEGGTLVTSPAKLSPVNIINVITDDLPVHCSSQIDSSFEPLVLPTTVHDVDDRMKKEPTPEIEIIGEKMVIPQTKNSRWDKPSSSVTKRIHFSKKVWAKESSITTEDTSKSTLVPSPQKPVSSVPPLRSIFLSPSPISSFSPSSESRPEGTMPPIWSNQPNGRLWPSPPVMPNSSRTAGVLEPMICPTPPAPSLIFPTLPNGQLRLKEIDTMLAVLRKIAWELESELLDNSEALPDSISFTSSIGNPETTLFVGYSVRKSNDPVCYSEGRYWSLVQLYQSLHYIFPSCVLNDIRNLAVNGLWMKVDHILTHTTQLFALAAMKLKELARLSHFAKSGDLQMVVQQRLVITHDIENASRAFWGAPPTPATGIPRFP